MCVIIFRTFLVNYYFLSNRFRHLWSESTKRIGIWGVESCQQQILQEGFGYMVYLGGDDRRQEGR